MQLPDLHLDIHVYSEVPKDRFVFINMSKLREGSQLAEGPVVAEITPDGVVLGHQGQYFLLSRE
jgi:general secretion pathway protein B